MNASNSSIRAGRSEERPAPTVNIVFGFIIEGVFFLCLCLLWKMY